MTRAELTSSFDQYLRRENTLLAKTLKRISPDKGRKYRNGATKRATELAIATPIALATLPVVGALAVAKKLEDGGDAFYVQKRLSQKGEIPVIKIRCMVPNADTNNNANLRNAINHGQNNDPRNTAMGRFMRRYELEELPQFLQILTGQLSLINVRAAPQYVFDYLKDKRPATFDDWSEAYFEGNRPGIISPNSAFNEEKKDDLKRHHYDEFYAKNASLGFDLYILYKTGLKMVNKLFKK